MPTAFTEKSFPDAEIEERLRLELGLCAQESSTLRGSWEPLLDSLQMVSVITGLEDLFGHELPPEDLVRSGGYQTVEEGVVDMKSRLERFWKKHNAVGTSS